jgi:hypothetical protein
MEISTKAIGKMQSLMGKVIRVINTVGTYYFANGDKYAGDFKDNLKHGEGNPRI